MTALVVVAVVCLLTGLAIGALAVRQMTRTRTDGSSTNHAGSQLPKGSLPDVIEPGNFLPDPSDGLATPGPPSETIETAASPTHTPTSDPDCRESDGPPPETEDESDRWTARLQRPRTELSPPPAVPEEQLPPRNNSTPPAPVARAAPSEARTRPSTSSHPASMLAPLHAKPLKDGVTHPTIRAGSPSADSEEPQQTSSDATGAGAAAPYVKVGISASDATRWIGVGIGPKKAVAWRNDHFSAESARRWSDAGFAPSTDRRATTHAQPWRDSGVEAHLARQWADIGVDARGRRDWLHRGYGVAEAAAMIQRGARVPASAPVRGGPDSWRTSEDLIVLDIDEADLSLAADLLNQEGHKALGSRLEQVLRDEEPVISVELLERSIDLLHKIDATYGYRSAGRGQAFASPLQDALERRRPALVRVNPNSSSASSYGATRSGTKIHIVNEGQTALCGAIVALGSATPTPEELCTRCASMQ